MTTIIAGTFDSITRAAAAASELLDRGCGEQFVSTIHNNALSQHAALPARADEDADRTIPLARRRAGITVAVNADRVPSERAVIAILHEHAALLIEKTQGEWRDGKWTDFDRPAFAGYASPSRRLCS